MDRYIRNRIYVSEEEQDHVRATRLLLAGAGLGSAIAECALRFGFEDIVIADGGKVETADLSSQNYVRSDIGRPKAECLAKRLLKINPKATISFDSSPFDRDNIEGLLDGVDIAVNTLAFNSDIPFVLDEVCSAHRIPVLHPCNFGWGAFLTILKPGGYQLTELAASHEGFEIKLAEFVARYSAFWNMPNRWLDEAVEECRSELGELPMPQLAVASWIVAGHCVNAMFDIITGREVKYFPKFYFSSLRCDPA